MSKAIISTLIFIFWASLVGAQEIETVTVTGIGSTKSEAIIDAQRQALTQVVGKYVVPRDIFKNRRELSENVYSYSNGFVSSFKIESESNDNGLFELIAEVGVSRTKLFATIEGLNISRLSVGDQPSAIATGVAAQSKNFRELVSSGIYESLESQKIYDVVVKQILIDAEPPSGAEPETKIYLGTGFFISATSIEIGDSSYDSDCKKTPTCEKYSQGLLTPLIIDIDLNLKSTFVENLHQLFSKTSVSQNSVTLDCEISCEIEGSNNEKVTNDPAKFYGVLITSQDGRSIKYEFTKKNERILDGLTSNNKYKNLFIKLTFLDFNDGVIDELKYRVTRFNSSLELDFSDHVRAGTTPSYGERGLLAFQNFFSNEPELTRATDFMLGVNTNNYAVFNGETFNVRLPVAVTEEFIKKFKDIAVSVTWENYPKVYGGRDK